MMYLKLFLEFFKVSCFTFGGAYGAIPLIRDMVLKNGWITEERLTYMIAVSESTPGPIIVNLATYIGNDQAGFWGSLISTVGVVLPAYLVIMLVLLVLKNTIQNKYVQAVLRGLKPCVAGIILAMGVYLVIHSCLPFGEGTAVDVSALLITLVLALILFAYQRIMKKQLSPIQLILCAAALGMMVFGGISGKGNF